MSYSLVTRPHRAMPCWPSVRGGLLPVAPAALVFTSFNVGCLLISLSPNVSRHFSYKSAPPRPADPQQECFIPSPLPPIPIPRLPTGSPRVFVGELPVLLHKRTSINFLCAIANPV